MPDEIDLTDEEEKDLLDVWASLREQKEPDGKPEENPPLEDPATKVKELRRKYRR